MVSAHAHVEREACRASSSSARGETTNDSAPAKRVATDRVARTRNSKARQRALYTSLSVLLHNRFQLLWYKKWHTVMLWFLRVKCLSWLCYKTQWNNLWEVILNYWLQDAMISVTKTNEIGLPVDLIKLGELMVHACVRMLCFGKRFAPSCGRQTKNRGYRGAKERANCWHCASKRSRSKESRSPWS